ncbi:MAG: flagellar export protein FliJ [Hespellia sp.]|nr:flagellar export protein FliJ [Hespellia sp.]
MARKKKETLTLTEQLKAVEKDIAEHKDKIKGLEQKKKEIAKKITEEEKDALYNAVVNSGMAVQECMEMINEHLKKNTELS